MMHMWMWFGYELGDFMFPGLAINSRWSFALTWIALFFIALLYEGSKVYLARVQRDALKKLYPYRSDERRNLLCDREQGGMEPTTSRNTSTGQVSRWASVRVRALVNTYQSSVFMIHSTVGYLLMLAVMIYNVHLLLAVVFGTMLGYFLFGTKLTRLQMQCFSTKRTVICTPECDDTDRCNTEKCSWEVCEGKLCKEMDALELQQADTQLCPDPYGLPETSTPPLLDSAPSSESDFFICRTRTCVQPSHYFRASTSQDNPPDTTCYYGAKKCPSKVARIMKKTECHESEKEDSPSVEDVQLLRSERQGCCKKKAEPPPEITEGHSGHHENCCKKEDREEVREQSPQITCCNSKSESQEHIVA